MSRAIQVTSTLIVAAARLCRGRQAPKERGKRKKEKRVACTFFPRALSYDFFSILLDEAFLLLLGCTLLLLLLSPPVLLVVIA